MKVDQYKEIANPAEGVYKEKGSKFYGFAFPVKTVEDVQYSLEKLRKEHNKARHHCYAYRLGTSGNQFRANDDGEPSGTAGKPILGQIDKFDTTNTLVVVVRYFGGKLLGASGLVNAYKKSAADTLGHARFVNKMEENHFTLHFHYHKMSDVMRAIKEEKIRLVNTQFNEQPYVTIAIAKSESNSVLIKLQCSILHCFEQDLAMDMKYEDLKIIPLL